MESVTNPMDPSQQIFMQQMPYQMAGGMQPMSNFMSGFNSMPQMQMPNMMSNPQMFQSVSNNLTPVVRVTVDGVGFLYHLTEEDLSKVFTRYGTVADIVIEQQGSSALVQFTSMLDAQASINDLDGKVLNGTNGSLRVGWNSMSAPMDASAEIPPVTSMDKSANLLSRPSKLSSGRDAQLIASNTKFGRDSNVNAKLRESTATISSTGAAIRKYTARFDIGIENDAKFQVARRIIGTKGTNMKRIVKHSNAKLRLRGRGSGFLEGSSKQESSEALHLCISCREPEGYQICIRLVEELLLGIYSEYQRYCRQNDLTCPKLRINMREHPLIESESGPSPRENVEDGYGGDSQVSALMASLSHANNVVAHQQSMLAQQQAMMNSIKQNQHSQTSFAGNYLRPIDRKGSGTSKNADGPRVHNEPEPGVVYPDEHEILDAIDRRNAARRVANYLEADRIRDELRSKGIALLDDPGARGKGTQVTKWRYWR